VTEPRAVSRAAGMLAGVAVGDALGMPTEFLSPDTIRDWYGEIRGLVEPDRRHPHHDLPLGSVTDDTDQTWIIAELILEVGRLRPAALANRLLEWSHTDRVSRNRFVGPSTQKALEAISSGVAPDQAGKDGITVGAAMRVAPLAICFRQREDLIEQVVASCRPTHNTQVAISGAMAMAFALLESLRDEATTTSIGLAAQQGAVEGRAHGAWSWTPPIDRRIARALSLVEGTNRGEALAAIYELIGVGYYPWELVPAALGLVHWARGDPGEAMLAAANLGGDTDTLASLAGALCGGLQGVEVFDQRLLIKIEQVNRLQVRELASRLVSAAKIADEGERQSHD